MKVAKEERLSDDLNCLVDETKTSQVCLPFTNGIVVEEGLEDLADKFRRKGGEGRCVR